MRGRRPDSMVFVSFFVVGLRRVWPPVGGRGLNSPPDGELGGRGMLNVVISAKNYVLPILPVKL